VRPRVSGFTLVELMIVIAVIAVIAAIAVPNLIAARKTANEAAAIGSLRTLVTAQTMFRESDKDGNGADYAGTLTQLGTYRLIDPTLASGTKQGYDFEIGVATAYDWNVQAYPVSPGRSGDRYFFTDESGVIRFNRTAPATVNDPPIP